MRSPEEVRLRNHFDLSDYPYAPRTYWLNHSMVRVQACWAAALL